MKLPLALILLTSCLPEATSANASYLAGGEKCIAEAGTRAEADSCLCENRIVFGLSCDAGASHDGGSL